MKKLMALALLIALLLPAFATETEETAAETVVPSQPALSLIYNNPLPEIFEKVSPSVAVLAQVSYTWDKATDSVNKQEKGSGSAVYIKEGGYFLTNHHVIEGASSISVALYDGTIYEAALIGYDESNDIAVLKVEAQDLPPVILGDSDNLNVGDPVVAIGNPLGELTFSLTAGLVSAMNREVTMSSSVTMNLIQTDCAINSGNSGGALFNMYGEVIGVTNAKYSSSSASEASIDNIGFAIPVNTIRPIVESIIEKGYIARPYIGISVSDVSAETQLYGIPAGVAVQAVTEDAPAAQAGLQAGDVITAVNGIAMDSDALVEYVGSAAIGDTLIMEIYRQGQTLTLSVTVGEKIQSALANEEQTEHGMPGQFGTPESQGGFPFGGFSGRR